MWVNTLALMHCAFLEQGSFWGSAVVTVAGCIAVNLPGVRSRHQRFPTRREELWRTGAVLGTILAVSVLVVLPAISRYLRQVCY